MGVPFGDGGVHWITTVLLTTVVVGIVGIDGTVAHKIEIELLLELYPNEFLA